MVLEHLVSKFDQFLWGTVDLAQKPAFDDTREGKNVNMLHQRDVLLRDVGLHCADFRSDLLDCAVDDGVDIRLEKAFEVVAADGVQRTEADRLIFFYLVEQLQKPFLPEQRPLVLLEQRDCFLLEHPAQQVVNVCKVVIEILTADSCTPRQVVNRDFVDGLLHHQLLERHRQRVLRLI